MQTLGAAIKLIRVMIKLNSGFFQGFGFFLAVMLAGLNSNAQLSGPKTIPADYATVAAFVTDLNAQGARPRFPVRPCRKSVRVREQTCERAPRRHQWLYSPQKD